MFKEIYRKISFLYNITKIIYKLNTYNNFQVATKIGKEI